jgi:hypothetical protein
VAVQQALQESTSLFLSLLKIDRIFFFGGGGGDGRLRNIVGMERKRFASRLKIGRRGDFNGEWSDLDKPMFIKPSDYLVCLVIFL